TFAWLLFFFQAEDGIRGRNVTGVQTCALPILEDAEGRERRVLNAKETTLAAQKQQAIRDAFKDWIWRDPERRRALVHQYNEEMRSEERRVGKEWGGGVTAGAEFKVNGEER